MDGDDLEHTQEVDQDDDAFVDSVFITVSTSPDGKVYIPEPTMKVHVAITIANVPMEMELDIHCRCCSVCNESR